MREVIVRECARYDLDYDRITQASNAAVPKPNAADRAWWDYAILACALGVFVSGSASTRAYPPSP